MTSSPPRRRIASHKLFLDGQLLDRPWVDISPSGHIIAHGHWTTPLDLDRMPHTEFFPGILLPGRFALLTPPHPLSLPALLATLHPTHPAGLTLLEGIDLRTGAPLQPRVRRLV